MAYKALGFYSLDELNQYLTANPKHKPLSLAQGFVANSMAVIFEIKENDEEKEQEPTGTFSGVMYRLEQGEER